MLHRGGLHEKATWAGEPGWSLTAPEPLFCFQHPPLAPFHETGHVKRVFSASPETRNCFLCRRHPAGGLETATREWSRQLGKDGRDRLWVVTNTGQHLQFVQIFVIHIHWDVFFLWSILYVYCIVCIWWHKKAEVSNLQGLLGGHQHWPTPSIWIQLCRFFLSTSIALRCIFSLKYIVAIDGIKWLIQSA